MCGRAKSSTPTLPRTTEWRPGSVRCSSRLRQPGRNSRPKSQWCYGQRPLWWEGAATMCGTRSPAATPSKLEGHAACSRRGLRLKPQGSRRALERVLRRCSRPVLAVAPRQPATARPRRLRLRRPLPRLAPTRPRGRQLLLGSSAVGPLASESRRGPRAPCFYTEAAPAHAQVH